MSWSWSLPLTGLNLMTSWYWVFPTPPSAAVLGFPFQWSFVDNFKCSCFLVHSSRLLIFCLSGSHGSLFYQLVFWCSCHLFLPHRIFVLYSERTILDLDRHIFIKWHSYASIHMPINETSCLSILKIYHMQHCFLTQTYPKISKNSNRCTMASVGEILFFK